MDDLLCDELLQEIFQRLPPATSSVVSFVCKRWLFLYRTSKTSLSLRFDFSTPLYDLSRYPHLSTLSLVSENPNSILPSCFFSDRLLLSVAASCFNLRHLRFLAGPVSSSALISFSYSAKNLTSLNVPLLRPLSFRWLVSFPTLKELSVLVSSAKLEDDLRGDFDSQEEEQDGVDESSELALESLCVSGIGVGDRNISWLWRSCTKLRRLQLRNCESIGDDDEFSSSSSSSASSPSFVMCLQGIQELELRTCRSIADAVLIHVAEHCRSLNSLLLYDGGSRDGLHQFISRCRCNLQRLDLRLPLDLDNDHLSAVADAESFRGLASLRLQSCCLVTGDGLKILATAMSGTLEELALINCYVIERESGLLTTLGQNLRRLRKLDLSYNEMLLDKELVSTLVSRNSLVDIQLKGCRGLTSAAMISMSKNCKLLESVDITQCCGIGVEAIESFVLNSPRLRRFGVEKSKLSDIVKTWASQKYIEVVG